MFGDLLIPTGGAVWEQFSDPMCERLNVLLVEILAADSFSLSSSCPDFVVSQTFGFRLLQRLLFDKQPLAFIASARAAEFQNNG